MKVLVYPHLMEIGGSQLNAVELAERVQAAGHEVVLYAPPGELNAVAERHGLDVVRSPAGGRWPTLIAILQLSALVRRRSVDLVHGYEWGPSVELALGPYALLGKPMLTTVMSMDVPHLIPVHSPLVVGTAELAEGQTGIREVHLAEPWIDTRLNRAGVSDRSATRAFFGISEDDLLVVVVCRLTTEHDKSAGVVAAMHAVNQLNHRPRRDQQLRLLVVGDGDQMPAVQASARQLNQLVPGQVVIAGPLLDPRPAYDCADIVIGMGSSALKGLAFAKPLIVQGTDGWWTTFTSETLPVFQHQGFFGHGTETSLQGRAGALERELLRLLALSSPEREALGRVGRAVVESEFSLDAACRMHLALFEQILADAPNLSRRVATAARTLREVVKFKIARGLSERRERRLATGSPEAAASATQSELQNS